MAKVYYDKDADPVLLKGKTIALPMGAAAERITVAALKKAGLDPAKDVKILNLDIREQGPLVLGGADALVARADDV